jgi:hypothetical protein
MDLPRETARASEGAISPESLPDDPERFAPPQLQKTSRARRLLKATAAAIFLFILLVGWLAFTAPLSKSLEPIAPPQITLLASDGTPIARNGAVVEAPVKVRKLPEHVTQSFIAIEDRRFYSHWGLDARGLARAAWTNLTTGRTQGGSTITQQLAKFTFLTPERSLTRKAREALIAVWLEFWLSKDQILERYLSNAYFGDNTYGLRAASLHYFSRQPEKLTPGQAAMLAGLVQAPSRLAPTRNYKLAGRRMKMVLHALVETGHMTEAEAARVVQPVLHVRASSALPTGTYFADWALPEARKLSDVGYSRQTITTTLDSRLQAAARRAVRQAPGGAQVALVAMRTNGEVVAMVGGKNYEDSPFNRATQARRQPGSTFKLFVYTRQPDNATARGGWVSYEVAGGSHMAGEVPGLRDRASFGASPADIAKARVPRPPMDMSAMANIMPVGARMNDLPWAPIARGAYHNLQLWVRQGVVPPHGTPIAVDERLEIRRDPAGNAIGGIRTPYIDAPTGVHTGYLQAGGGIGAVMGARKPFTAEELSRLYPEPSAYVSRFSASTDRLRASRWISPADAEAMKKAAADKPMSN